MCFCSLITKLGDLFPKLIEDILAGTILLLIGFWFFKRQEKFKASAQEVKERCKELEKFLEPFIILNLQLIEFERRLTEKFQTNITDFLDDFINKGKVESQLSISILGDSGLQGLNNNIPSGLAKTVSFHEPLVSLINAGMLVSILKGSCLETLRLVNEQKPSPDVEMLKNSWLGYLNSRKKYSNILKSLDSLAHKSITGSYDWNEFEQKLSNIKQD